MARRQGTYWIGTIPRATDYEPQLHEGLHYLKGQLEQGQEETAYEHYQVFFICKKKSSLAQVKAIFGNPGTTSHFELTRSAAAEAYVWKEETRIGEQFEFGAKPFKRNSFTDWEEVRTLAKSGTLDEIPADIFVRCYPSLCRIRSDYFQPTAMDRTSTVFWGPTGTGKSHRAWTLGGDNPYYKDPRTKFWDGYTDQKVVIFDEFRGTIDISHILRWIDKYPVRVEIKGSTKVLLATQFYFTSNIHPSRWYPDLDAETYEALERRLDIQHITEREQ